MPDSWHRLHAPPPVVGVVDAHLDDRSLTEPATSADLKHLADCLYCTRRAALANAARDQADPDVADLDAFDEALTARLREKRSTAFTAALPAAVAVVVRAAPARPDVVPAQLWRLSWQATTTLVGVISTDITSAVVAPVTPDVDLADGYTLVVPGTGSGLDGPWAMWLALARPVPLFVFDRYYATLTLPGDGRGVAQVAREVIASYRTGDATHGAPVGATPISEMSVSALTDSLREQLSVFADAVPERQAATITSEELQRALIALSPEQLGQAGLRRGDLLGVVRGTEALNDQQAMALAPVLGFDVEQLLALDADLPDGLIREAHRVEWRAARELWAAEKRIEPVDAPMQLAKSAYDLAARTNNSAAGSRWRALVQYALQDQLTQLSPES